MEEGQNVEAMRKVLAKGNCCIEKNPKSICSNYENIQIQWYQIYLDLRVNLKNLKYINKKFFEVDISWVKIR